MLFRKKVCAFWFPFRRPPSDFVTVWPISRAFCRQLHKVVCCSSTIKQKATTREFTVAWFLIIDVPLDWFAIFPISSRLVSSSPSSSCHSRPSLPQSGCEGLAQDFRGLQIYYLKQDNRAQSNPPVLRATAFFWNYLRPIFVWCIVPC